MKHLLTITMNGERYDHKINCDKKHLRRHIQWLQKHNYEVEVLSDQCITNITLCNGVNVDVFEIHEDGSAIDKNSGILYPDFADLYIKFMDAGYDVVKSEDDIIRRDVKCEVMRKKPRDHKQLRQCAGYTEEWHTYVDNYEDNFGMN